MRRFGRPHDSQSTKAHILQGFQDFRQSIQQMKQEQEQLKYGISTKIESLEESIRHSPNMPKFIAWSLKCMKSILQGRLDEIGDSLAFRVTEFPRLKNVWYSPPFAIATKVRVHLSVHLKGIGRGEGSHVSLSLILMDVLKKAEYMSLEYNVSISTIR